MIDVRKDFPFEDCEICQVFEPDVEHNRMFGDSKCLVDEVIITCSRYKICREIRRHIDSKEAEQNGADK